MHTARRSCCEFSPAECDRMRELAKERTAERFRVNSKGMKSCKRCGHQRKANAFYLDPGFKDNRDSVCKACRRSTKSGAERRAKQ